MPLSIFSSSNDESYEFEIKLFNTSYQKKDFEEAEAGDMNMNRKDVDNDLRPFVEHCI